MRNALFILLAMFVAAPCAATDDEPASPSAPPAEAVEVMPVEHLPIVAEVPSSAHETPDAEAPGCYRQTREDALHFVPYVLIVGIAMDLPAQINLPAAMGGMAGVYLGCKIKKTRAARRASSNHPEQR